MAFGEASLTTLFIGTSTTKDVEPTTYQTMQPTAHSLAPSSASFEDETIDPSGDGIDKFRINKEGKGDISAHWRPTQWDGPVSCVMRNAFGSALSLTLTVSFAAPDADGLQTITDDGTDGFATVPLGSSIFVGGAIANALNGGLRTVLARTDDVLTVYNPSGVVSAADAGVTFVHAGSMGFGTSNIYAWVERLFSDGTNLFKSEWYKNGRVSTWSLDFPAQAPTRCVFGFETESPVFRRANGAPPILKQRGGSDVAVTGDRLVHGMEDVRQIILYDPTSGVTVKRFDDTNCAAFGFTIGRTVTPYPVVGTSNIANRSISRPTVDLRLDCYLDDDSSWLHDLWDIYPDGLALGAIWGAAPAAAETGANSTAYGIHCNNVRMQTVPNPVQGSQAVKINGTASATTVRVTRF